MQAREWIGGPGRGRHLHPRFKLTGVVVSSNVYDALVARRGRYLSGLNILRTFF